MSLRFVAPLLVIALVSLPGHAQCPASPALVETILEPFPAVNEGVGASVALSGDTLALASLPVTAAPPVTWSVHVFDRDASGVWTETAEVTNPQGNAIWGLDLALSADTLFVGDPSDMSWEGDAAGAGSSSSDGVVHVFERNHGGPDAWGEAQRLLPPSGGAAFFGNAIAVYADTLVVTAPFGGPGGNGAAFVYRRLAQGWHPVEVIRAFAGASLFGSDVAIGPGRIVIGAERTNNDVGMVAVYEQDSTGKWQRTALLQPSGPAAKYFFGASVALSGDRIAVGAPAGPISPVNPGRVRIYDLDPSGAWVETQVVAPLQNLASGAHFGTDVALSGDTLMAQAPYLPARPAWFFDRNQGGPDAWGEVLKHAPSGFGEVLAIDGDRGLIGGASAIVNNVASGAGFLFEGLSAEPLDNYCTAGTSSNGCTAQISAAGCASASAASGFTLSATGVDGTSEFVFGTNGRQATPWGTGNSLQCVVQPWTRTGLIQVRGTPGLCDGVVGLDLNNLWCASCPRPGKNPGAGAVVQAQLLVYDAIGGTSSLSDAIEFVVAP